MHNRVIEKALINIDARLNANNFKEIKLELIALQQQINTSAADEAEKARLRQAMQAVFDRINVFRDSELAAIETEAYENYIFLKNKLIECLSFVEGHSGDYEASWTMLLALQDAFRGRRMRAEEREYLYTGLQQLFDVVKARKDKATAEMAKASEKLFEDLDGEVKQLCSIAETADIDTTWEKLVDLSNQIRSSTLVFAHRKALLDSLQDAFTIVKIRREERQHVQSHEAEQQAKAIGQKLQHAAAQIESHKVFKDNWELLLSIQNDFRGAKLSKPDRESLYAELQILFETLKADRDKEQAGFEQAANASLEHLQPMVEKATELARKAQEFKKTKNFLIKVQREFKGRRMRADDRERLYTKLQSAFDTLNRRINEHIAQRKEVREFRVESKISDLQKQIEDLEEAINNDMEKLQLLENKLDDSRALPSHKSDEEQLLNQIKIMRAAIDAKSKQLLDAENEIHKSRETKDWLENI